MAAHIFNVTTWHVPNGDEWSVSALRLDCKGIPPQEMGVVTRVSVEGTITFCEVEQAVELDPKGRRSLNEEFIFVDLSTLTASYELEALRGH